MSSTGLMEDVAQVMQPLHRLAGLLGSTERELIEQVCRDVLAICEDEEEQSSLMVDEMNKMQDEMEDK